MARWLVSGLVLSLLPLTVAAEPRRRHGPVGGDTYHLPPRTAGLTRPGAEAPRSQAAFRASGPVRVFLNRAGGRLIGGSDDPARGRSWIANQGDGGQVDVPPYPGGDRAWRQVVACVQSHFAPFAVDVVDQRPGAGDYSMMMVGGSPDLIGAGASVGGIAPSDAGVLRRAVGYAFVGDRDEPTTTCTTIAHEIGHTLGLDHAMACDDLMSYEWCGPKRFVDQAAACGEFDARTCGDGGAAQNSYRRLGSTVGWRSEAPSPPTASPPTASPPTASPPTAPPWVVDADVDRDVDDDVDEATDEAGAQAADATDADADADADATDAAPPDDVVATAPAPDTVATASLAIIPGRTRRRGDRWTSIELHATASAGVAEVYLLWASADATYVWPCGDIPADAAVTCARDGAEVRFEVLVGTGPRAVAAAMIDGAGRTVETSISTLLFR